MDVHQEEYLETGECSWRALLKSRKIELVERELVVRGVTLNELGTEQTGELSRSRLHPSDLGTNEQEVETLKTLSEKYVKQLQEIDEAFERLDQGEFGRCLECGEMIPIGRLKVTPETRYCTSCEEDRESNLRQRVRPGRSSEIYTPRQVVNSNLIQELREITVAKVMIENPITVQVNESLEIVASILFENHFRHLPVIDSTGDLQGVISDRDILSFVMQAPPGRVVERLEQMWSKYRARHVMTKTPETVSPDTDLAEAGSILLENRISSLPVVEGNRLVGILTESDFVRLMV